MLNLKTQGVDAGAGLFSIPIHWMIAMGAITIVVLLIARQKRRITAVAPDLRSPILYAPGLINRFTRSFVKKGMDKIPLTSPDGVRVATHQVPHGEGTSSTRLVTFEREGSSGVRPVLLWMHGGGYVVGTPEQDIAFIAKLLARFDMVVASVDYRLAPDHPFPAPLDDCHAALEWIVQHAGELGIDPARVIIGGQSAGAGLAAALVQRTVDQGPVVPIFQMLIYPMLDSNTVARRDNAGTGQFVWTPANNRYGWQSYLGSDPTSGSYPIYAVPAARADIGGLPPAWIGVGSLDLFYAEDRLYAERLQQAGVACELHIAKGAYHVFNAVCPEAPTTKRFNDSMFAALSKALG